MKTLFAIIALVSLAVLSASAHPEPAYGLFWKNGLKPATRAGQELPQDVWRFAFVSEFHW